MGLRQRGPGGRPEVDVARALKRKQARRGGWNSLGERRGGVIDAALAAAAQPPPSPLDTWPPLLLAPAPVHAGLGPVPAVLAVLVLGCAAVYFLGAEPSVGTHLFLVQQNCSQGARALAALLGLALSLPKGHLSSLPFAGGFSRGGQPSPLDPFPAKRLVGLPQFQGPHAARLLWGTYRPGLYFGAWGKKYWIDAGCTC